jgi:thioesterase domain-containing protein/acyl carrier protein
VVELPTYAFQREHYWLRTAGSADTSTRASGTEAVEKPHLPNLTERLDGLSVTQQQELAVATVRERVAFVLGYGGPGAIDADRPFGELAFDSLTAMELRNGLAEATGLPLPASLVFDYATPAELAESLLAQMREHQAVGTSDTIGVGALYQAACAEGRYGEAYDFLAVAARLRATFQTSSDLAAIPQPVQLATGPSTPMLVCFPATGPLSGPQELVRFAAGFQELRDVWALQSPGFRAGEKIPASFEALVRLHAETVSELVNGQPFVLAGHSAGGTIAHAVALRLEEIGIQAAGLVLLDTYEIGSAEVDGIQSVLLKELGERGEKFGGFTDVRLTATAGYYSILADWQSKQPASPTLFVGASELLRGGENEGAVLPTWSLAHERVDVPGDHFTMMSEHAEATASAVDKWIANVSPQNREHA